MVNAYGKALCRLWKGRCSVYIRKTKINEANGRNEPYEEPLFSDKPCGCRSALWRLRPRPTRPRGFSRRRSFLSQPALIFRPGSKIVVTQAGETQAYSRSGEPAFYSTHQEIMLAPFQRWA